MATNVSDLLESSKESQNPLFALRYFLRKENQQESSENFKNMRLVGYVLNIAYDKIRITTCDPFKINVGGIPRNSLLVMIPSNHEELPPHFTLLRVLKQQIHRFQWRFSKRILNFRRNQCPNSIFGQEMSFSGGH